jgi:hypothetical protein
MFFSVSGTVLLTKLFSLFLNNVEGSFHCRTAPCNISLVPFNPWTATLFFWTHLFQNRHGWQLVKQLTQTS